jgi:hypothetical protein
MIPGRLKRIAGSHPNSRLVARQSAAVTASMERSTLSAAWSSGGSGSSIHQDTSGGMVNSTSDASAPPAPASRTASASRCWISRPRVVRTAAWVRQAVHCGRDYLCFT